MITVSETVIIADVVLDSFHKYLVESQTKVYDFGLSERLCLQCFDTVGWATGRGSGL